MTIARVKNWVSEVLSASDLNAEFNNLITYLNASTIVFTKVGIGMTPSNILDITQTQNNTSAIKLLNANTSASAIAQLWLANSGTNALISLLGTGYGASGVVRADGLLISSGQGAGGLTLNTGAAKSIYFGINGVEAARIEDTNSALLIGTTTMQSGRKLIASSSAASVNVVRMENAHATPASAVIQSLIFTAASPDDNTAQFLQCTDGTTVRLIVYSDGDVLNHDNAYGAISKREIKQDIKELPSHWAAVKAYPLRQYRMIEDVEKHGEAAPVRRGVVADELEKVAPHLVKNGEYVVYSHMYLEAVAALQEAMGRIEALEAKAK